MRAAREAAAASFSSLLYHDPERAVLISQVQRTTPSSGGLVFLNTRCNATSRILHLVSLIRRKTPAVGVSTERSLITITRRKRSSKARETNSVGNISERSPRSALYPLCPISANPPFASSCSTKWLVCVSNRRSDEFIKCNSKGVAPMAGKLLLHMMHLRSEATL